MISSDMSLVTDLRTIQQLTAQRHDEFEVMQYTLELMEEDLPDSELDMLVDQIAAPIIASIDCTQCGNCCRSLDVYLTQYDANRLAEGLLIPVDEVETRYIDHEQAEQVEEWGMFRQKPCSFLNGKRCSIYAHRPESCRIYPVFTPDFRWSLADIIEGAGLCPIIYNVLDQMVNRVEQMETTGNK